jgi:hypothetical protein
VIEGKVADTPNAHQVVSNQAVQRLETGLAHVAIAIVYPEHLRSVEFAELPTALSVSSYEFAVFSENGPSAWRSGKIHQILAELRRVQELLARDDAVQEAAEQLREKLDAISGLLAANQGVCDRLTAILGVGVPASETASQARERGTTVAKISALSVANAFIFQEQLSAADSRVQTLRNVLAAEDLIARATEHWTFICDDIDYVPIFRIARDILLQLPADDTSNTAVRQLAERALRICARKAALRHDLMGRIYHWLLHDAKYLGTYYTSVPAATILLKVALNPARWKVDFGNISEVSELRIADLACGTGTLLMAASQALSDNFVRQSAAAGQPLNDAVFLELHRALMESILYGYDVLTSAIHLTASTLALMAPEIAFDQMHLFSMPLGLDEQGQPRLGSIDFVESDAVPTQVDITDSEHAVGVVTGGGLLSGTAIVPQLDLCVMNPPFTRSVGGNLLFGSLPDQRGRMQAELRRRLRPANRPPLLANTTAGLGSVFVAVADPYIKTSGRMALVLPAALLNGIAWSRTRELLRGRYVIETVIASHDPAKWSFSENTDLSEVLMVARKGLPSGDEQTIFVNLWRNPRTIGDALAVAAAINDAEPASLGTASRPKHGVTALRIGDIKIGEVVALPAVELDGDLLGCTFAQTDLVRLAWFLAKGVLTLPGARDRVPVPIASLGQWADIGPDRRDIADGFTVEGTPTPYPALWGHSADGMQRIALSPNRWLSPRSVAAEGRNLRDVTLLWPKAGRVMIAEKMRLNTQRIVATRLDQEALSNVWWPCKLKTSERTIDKEKALTLWLNSTLGLTLMLSNRIPTEGPWAQFKKPTLERMPVLNVNGLDEEVLTRMARVYDAICNEDLQPLSTLASDEIRQQIDRCISDCLSLPDLTPVRDALGREPVLTVTSLADEVDWTADPGTYEQLSLAV